MAILVQSNKKPSVTFPTLTGSIVTFNSQYAGLPLKSHKIALTATQSGSGTPSPSNPRPITGYSAINISAAGKNLVDFTAQTVTTITIGSTVYGGEYDARTGVLTVTHASVLFNGTEQGWTLNQVQSNNAVYMTLSDKKAGWQTSICDKMQNVNGCWGNSTDMGLFCDHPSLKRLYFNRPDNSLSLFFTVDDWKTWLSNNNVRVCYELENPQTIQLPPCPIDTLEGVNNIWADTGETTAEYIKIGG